MIYVNPDNLEFHLQTRRSSYLIKVAETGHLQQLYFGNQLRHRNSFSNLDHRFKVKIGSSTDYHQQDPHLTLDSLLLEAPCFGKGDYRSPMLHMLFADGSRTCDLIYKSHHIETQKPPATNLPTAHLSNSEEDGPSSITIVLEDSVKSVEVRLHYTVFYDSDCITRRATIHNCSSSQVSIDHAFSACLDLPREDFDLIHLEGKWIKEAQVCREPLHKGIKNIDSKKGVSSANHNPFVCLADKATNEMVGECYAMGLMYSGNHQTSIEVSPFSYTRVLMGVNSFDFSWQLEAGEVFETPEVVLSYSGSGLNGLSQNLHQFINHHVIPQQWVGKPRPIQVNNWEATYFDFDYSKLKAIGKKAKQLGIELFVLDDGWFGQRDDDQSSLGDFFDNPKLRGGIARVSQAIKKMDMQFGIWVEPEMISVNSQLYREHPDWAIQHPDRSASPGRNQLVLDMSNPDVIDYLTEQLSDVFERANVDYVKWDHNRNFSDLYSNHLPHNQQAEFTHRYVLGLYALLRRLTERFPNILFESCSSGGNRFDMGMLSYMPQTWTSDNTDAIDRTSIQYGTSLFYPLSTMSAHVSGKPSHQVLRHTPIETRFNVAAFGNLGYQLDITKLTKFETQAIKQQISFYKKHRELLQYGTFLRLASPFDNNSAMWMVVNDDKTEALIGYYQKLQQSNGELEKPRIPALDEELLYTIENRTQYSNIRIYGDLINEELPININDRGVIHGILSNNTMHQVTKECYQLYGDQLAHFGLPLKSQFLGTEMTEEVRFIGDFGSRLYLVTAQ